MDYKYIDQLLEKYWNAETSAAEEQILRAFFAQDVLPAHLARFKPLFDYERSEQTLGLSADFDERVTRAALGQAATPATTVRTEARHFSMARRLRPLYRAAAAVAIVTLVGTAVQHAVSHQPADNATWDYDQQAYTDSYKDPQQSLELTKRALDMMKQGPSTAAADSTVAEPESAR